VLVAGGPLSGKSTLLGALAGLVPGGERVVSVEEVAELPGGEGRVALETRPAEDGRPAVGFVDVVRAALRMRPDRLIVGEIRGAEALEVLAAMASGDGAFATVAGDSVSAALARLETLARLAAPDASPRGLRELVVGAAGVVVHVSRYADGVRRVTSVAEVTGLQADGYATRELFSFQVQGHGESGIRGRFAGAGVVPKFYEQLEARGEKADPALFR
jgi:pilus assembly protein CpaF